MAGERSSLTGGEAPAAPPRSSRRLQVVVGLGLGAAGAVASLRRGSPGATLPALASSAAAARPLYLPASAYGLATASAYETSLGIPIGDGLYEYENLVEMHQWTTLALSADVDLDASAWAGVHWSVPGTTGDEGPSPKGQTLTVKFDVAGVHAVVIRAAFDAVQGTNLSAFTVTAKYVRRELRDLTAADRNAYFSALHTLYATTQDAGELRYGPDFKSAAWFVRMHLYGAAQRDCDHWHDDAGFLTHHVGVTMLMERSLQAVDASVCSHYWDYTIDAERAYGNATYVYTESELFDPDWFGPAVPHHPDHVVDEGRWAYTPVLGVYRADNFLPRCSEFQKLLLLGYNSVGKLFSELNGALHGSVHIMLGGSWDFDLATLKASGDYDDSDWRSDQMLLGSKFLWRQGLLDCPKECSNLVDPGDCTCSCGKRIPNSLNGSEHDARLFLEHSGVQTVITDAMVHKARDALGGYAAIVDALCHVGHPGEMFTSAAPQDPHLLAAPRPRGALRAAHPHLGAQRHVHARRGLGLRPHDGRPVGHAARLRLERRRRLAEAARVPHGHVRGPPRENDTLPFEWPIAETTPGAQRYYTNAEFYELMAPWDRRVPYVYDKLETWPACQGANLVNNNAVTDSDPIPTRQPVYLGHEPTHSPTATLEPTPATPYPTHKPTHQAEGRFASQSDDAPGDDVQNAAYGLDGDEF
ncbi:hypothetical protein JL720_2261 [Aureococcus anophagefferens]|nr:hypothetical protein JL720_2261 [Aureococcus anophagefferens]